MAFEEVNPNNWEYENDGDFIEGFLVHVEEEVGPNKSKLYSLQTGSGSVVNVWGSTILDQRMNVIELGSYIKITYKGKAEAKGGKNPAKIFKVEIDKARSKD